MKRTCDLCAKEFTATRVNAKFCSKVCRDNPQRKYEMHKTRNAIATGEQNRCIYNPKLHSNNWDTDYAGRDKTCGKRTGNGGMNRWYCDMHHRQMAGGFER